MTKYTAKQIENAKRKYNQFVRIETAQDQSCYDLNPNEAERRAEYHNNIISKIKAGNPELEKEWKLFFYNEEVKKDQKAEASKKKITIKQRGF